MAELKTLNGYEIVDAKARQDLAELKIPSIEGLATEKYVDDATEDTERVVTSYISNYHYTKTETDSRIASAIGEIPETDLTGYATEAFVTAKIAEAELAGKDDDIDLSGYALTSDIPTKVSQLTNDKGYLTAVPEGYVTTIQLDPIEEAIEAIQSEYVSEYELQQTLNDYATKVYVDEAVANAASGEVNLTNYYTKSEVDTKMQKNYQELLDYYIDCHNRLLAIESTPSAEGRSY